MRTLPSPALLLFLFFGVFFCSLMAHPAAGQSFDETIYVDQHDPEASDEGPGTSDQPLLSIQEAMDRAAAFKRDYRSVKVHIAPGRYREAVEFAYTNHPAVQPGNNTRVTVEGAGPDQTFITGADHFDDWQREGGDRYSHAWPYDWGLSEDPTGGRIENPDLVLRREMVFVEDGSPGGERLRQVLTASDMEPGTFRVDEAANRIYAWPSGGEDLAQEGAEVAVRARGWYSQYENHFTLKGLSIKHVATPWIYGEGAVVVTATDEARIEDVVAQQSNFTGFMLQLNNGAELVQSKSLHNGYSGWMLWKGTDFTAEDVELSYNNWRGALGGHTAWGPGNKSLSIHGMTVNGLKAVGNQSRGLWLDTDHTDVVLEDIELRDNRGAGLFIEANQGPVQLLNAAIEDNQGYAILNANSENVTITDSELTGNQLGGVQISGALEGREVTNFETGDRFLLRTRNWTITGNTIAGGTEHLIGTTFGRDAWTVFVNTLTSDENTWQHPDQLDVFGWHNQEGLLSFAFEEWQDRTGQDQNSTFEMTEGGGGGDDGNVVFAVNAGGQAFTTPSGQPYQADTGFEGGGTYASNVPISGTEADALYQSERYGNFSYDVPLENGSYEVVFRFAEIYWQDAGERLFDVKLEGSTRVNDLDLFAQVGADAAYDVTETVEVTDGELNLAFETERNNAKLSAVLVRTTDGEGNGSRKAATAEAQQAFAGRPAELALQGNAPNPFRGTTTIRFAVPERQHVRLSVYDLLGRKVATLVDHTVAVGPHEVRWTAERMPSGTYFYRMEAGGGFSETGRMVLVR